MEKCLTLLVGIFILLQARAQTCQAFFTISPGSQCNVFEFTDTSTSNDSIVQWEYNFDDGTNSFSSNPEHMYIANGVYQVCLTITDASNCTSQYCNEVEVTCLGTDCIEPLIINQGIICGLIYDPVCGCDSVTYTNECEAVFYNGITSYVPGECALSVKEKVKLNITWGPNPVEDELILTFVEGKTIRYVLTSTNGSNLGKGQLTGGQSILNLERLKKGIYFLRLYADNRVKTIRFIKN